MHGVQNPAPGPKVDVGRGWLLAKAADAGRRTGAVRKGSNLFFETCFYLGDQLIIIIFKFSSCSSWI